MPEPLADTPNLDWLRKEAKRYLAELRKTNPAARLATAQFEVAARFGFSSWRAMKAHIDSLSIDGQLIAAARNGDAKTLIALLEKHPDKMHVRVPPYDGSLLHIAATHGHLPIVDLLLARGFDPNLRESGDNTYAMHWAAAHGHLDIVRRLADAGGDVIGRGDDHQLEVIGWAAYSQNRAVADFLISRGARHHIYSAIAFNDPEEVRRVAEKNPPAVNQRMSRNENHQTPLQFAIGGNRPAIVELLVELGADPLAVDGSGFGAVAYAISPDADRPVMQRIRTMLAAELDSAARGKRKPNVNAIDLLSLLALHDWQTAERLLTEGVTRNGALHLMAKRGDVEATQWLLARGADPNGRWGHWDSELTALHLAVLAGHAGVVRTLIDAGADPTIHDSKHDSDAIGWAEFFGRRDLIDLLKKKT